MSKIKEIFCLHHSHLDVGYTHPQEMLLELQCDYIEQAIDLCIKTAEWPEESRFRWTCEATFPLIKWLHSARPERIELFKRLVAQGYISVAALPMHTTPGCTALQLTQALQHLDEIRALTGSPITTAINHDVNGQPWTLSSLLLDSNVEFYITGINIHFGGIPFKRPYAFCWETPDGRELPSFVGEHYSLFSQFFFTDQGSTEKMHEGVQEYVKRIEEGGWQEDFVYLTATNPPLYDNNCPDAGLADLIRRYNEEGHEQKIRFVTPEMLYERIRKIGIEKLDRHKGDWTDYWNFGCASTAREVKISRRAKTLLHKSDFMRSFAQKPSEKRFEDITEQAYEKALLFDEHTWGASDSITDPHSEETYAQLNHKKDFAYSAADLAAYLVGHQIEQLAENPVQADAQEGVLVVNPTGVKVWHKLEVPADWTRPGRRLAALRAKEYLPYKNSGRDVKCFGNIEMGPFSVRKIPFAELTDIGGEQAAECSLLGATLRTPFYCVTLHPATHRIMQIERNSTGQKLLNEASEWGFFDLVEEHIDERFAAPTREAIFPRDLEKGNKSITQWQHDWRAVREGIRKAGDFTVEQDKESITLCYHSDSRSIKGMEQRITFLSVDERILLDAVFYKEPVEEPEGIYFTFPLNLQEGWECVYDTADTFVRLDSEQLGTVCRDYITVDKSVSLFAGKTCYTLACPDAPMVQIGGFQFGKENRKIERNEKPLLLAWPMNNYWNTNFAPSQEGKMSFHYELGIFDEFSEKQAYQMGVQASEPCAAGAAIRCPENSEMELLHYESETSVPIFVRPAYKQPGLLAAVKNFSSESGTCMISVPGRTLKAASVTDIQGNTKQELELSENGVNIVQRPNEITFIMLCME